MFWINTPSGRTSARDITIDHNTLLHRSGGSYTGVVFLEGAVVNLTLTNNISTFGSSGIAGNGTGNGLSALNRWATNYDVQQNVFVNGGNSSSYPPQNFFEASVNSVGFVNYGARDYTLTGTSAYINRATDGKDIGADFVALNNAPAGEGGTHKGTLYFSE